MVELPEPAPVAGEVVVRVRRCGVCRTDLKICRGDMPAGVIRVPHVPGHEIAGATRSAAAAGSGRERRASAWASAASASTPCRS